MNAAILIAIILAAATVLLVEILWLWDDTDGDDQ